VDPLKKMFDSLVPGGVLVTYCAQGQFKRNLKLIGFEVENLPGPPGKREMTRAIKPIESFHN
jgi:tRNA U34 5-methylaminomethyl-2-thiouridine-forming methyltransferase MnmC